MPETQRPRCIILGGGGHARVLIDSLNLTDDVVLHGILDPTQALRGERVLDIPVLGGDDLLSDLSAAGVERFLVGLGGVGTGPERRQLFALGKAHGLTPQQVRHPSAIVSRWVTVAEGVQILAGAIICPGVILEENVVINTGVIVDHDCLIGAHAHLATGARLAGNVQVGAGAFVGAGATVIQGVRIGANAMVGAGATVIRDVGPGVTVMGTPARP